MTSLRRREIQEREQAISTRVMNINQRLNYLSRYTVASVPNGPESWCIRPTDRMFQKDGFPILGNKFRLLINEDLRISSDQLIFTYFRYRLNKVSDIVSGTEAITDKLQTAWELRYDFEPRGDEHEMPHAGEPNAYIKKTSRRFPPFHIHINEQGVGDNLHYPLGIPDNPFDLIFEIMRLIYDDFIK